MESLKRPRSGNEKDVETKKSKTKDDDDAVAFEISKTKRATVSVFKGSIRVDLRAFYQPKDGSELLPTKKGLSLSVDEFHALKDQMAQIEEAILAKE